MNMEEYLSELSGQIRDKHARVFVADEIRSHIEDQAEAYESEGMDAKDAVSKAVAGMGDPVSVGIDLDRIHRPHMEWKFFFYIVFISFLSLAVQYALNRYMPVQTGTGIMQTIGRRHLLTVLLGIMVMLAVYRVDYTFLAGKSRWIGAFYLAAVIVLSIFFGRQVNGARRWIGIGSVNISVYAVLMLYLPVFAGILYEYRGKGRSVIGKILLWILAPAVSLVFIIGYVSPATTAFFLIAEFALFILALHKDWYQVNKKTVILGIMGTPAAIVSLGLIALWNSNGYQNARLLNWLAHLGIGSYPENADQGINYVNSRLNKVFANSIFLKKSDIAVRIMKELPDYRNDLILGSVAATCGLAVVAVVIISLVLLAVYVFLISLRQQNSLGYIIGCSAALAIGLQCISNAMIVFGLLPLTDSVLPFFTGGFSYMIVDYILLGLILSIYRYKDIRKEKKVMNVTLRRVE